MRGVVTLALLCAAGFGQAPSPDNLVREQRIVKVAGVAERWRLEWTAPPEPVCDATDGGFSTCPCTGFAYGERGPLALVRQRHDGDEERLDLTAFFEADLLGPGHTAVLPRWPLFTRDIGRDGDPALITSVRSRTPVRIMTLEDLDGDGQATEFFLQTDTAPCGKRMGIAVGLSRKQPTLHALTSVAHPERPLMLRIDEWQALARAHGAVNAVDWLCGDHGSEEQVELTMKAADGTIEVTRRVYACTPGAVSKKGRLLRTEAQ